MMSFCCGEVRANTISVWFLSRSSRYSGLMSFRSEPCTTQALASLKRTQVHTPERKKIKEKKREQVNHCNYAKGGADISPPLLKLSPWHLLSHKQPWKHTQTHHTQTLQAGDMDVHFLMLSDLKEQFDILRGNPCLHSRRRRSMLRLSSAGSEWKGKPAGGNLGFSIKIRRSSEPRLCDAGDKMWLPEIQPALINALFPFAIWPKTKVQ